MLFVNGQKNSLVHLSRCVDLAGQNIIIFYPSCKQNKQINMFRFYISVVTLKTRVLFDQEVGVLTYEVFKRLQYDPKIFS